jgi:diguanylate cyclase (GGDEF)-like protein/PAS domain S-box-containing protein
MKDPSKTKRELIEELAVLKQRLQKLERLESDHKQTEEELLEREENFRRSLDDSLLGVRISTTEGKTIYVNQAMLDIYGYDSVEEMKRMPVKERYTPQSYAEYKIRKEKRECGELDPSQYEISIVRKNGEVRHLQVFRKEILWNGVKQAQIIYQDITEHRRVEETLRQSEEKYRTILEDIQEGYYEVDIAGNLTFFNNSFCRIYGYSKEELMGMNYRQYTNKEHSEKLFQVFNKVYGTGKPAKEFDWQITRKDGTKRYIELSASLQKDSSGKPIGFQGIARDITDRKMMEAEVLALSITDQLTGLYNRRGFLSLAGQQLKLAQRNKSGMLLFFADLDRLKRINDTLGHEEGDKALIETATVFKETFRTSDIIARLGGDEYAALTVDITEAKSELFTARLQSQIDTRNHQENRRYRLSISVGCSYYDPENPCYLDELMAHADKSMYEQKQNKKSLLSQASALSNGNPQSNLRPTVEEL